VPPCLDPRMASPLVEKAIAVDPAACLSWASWVGDTLIVQAGASSGEQGPLAEVAAAQLPRGPKRAIEF
jgi:hypothetical protein